MGYKERTFITFSGKAGSGKDTFVEAFIKNVKEYACIYAPKYLEEVLKYQVDSGIDTTVFSFGLADYFKSLFARNFGYTEENKSEFRSQLQYFGTQIGRSHNENHWVYMIEDMIYCLEDKTPCKLFVVTDARFSNELSMFRGNDYYRTLNVVVKSKEDRIKMNEEQLSHASEAMANDDSIEYDFHINNFGSLEDLNAQAKDFAILILTKLEESYDTIPNN